jgi:hypothetical protein
MVAYATGGEPPEMTTIRAPASAGYCRLRSFDPDRVLAPGLRGIENDDPSIISIGSPRHGQPDAEHAGSLFRDRQDGADTPGAPVRQSSAANLPASPCGEPQVACDGQTQHSTHWRRVTPEGVWPAWFKGRTLRLLSTLCDRPPISTIVLVPARASAVRAGNRIAIKAPRRQGLVSSVPPVSQLGSSVDPPPVSQPGSLLLSGNAAGLVAGLVPPDVSQVPLST